MWKVFCCTLKFQGRGGHTFSLTGRKTESKNLAGTKMCPKELGEQNSTFISPPSVVWSPLFQGILVQCFQIQRFEVNLASFYVKFRAKCRFGYLILNSSLVEVKCPSLKRATMRVEFFCLFFALCLTPGAFVPTLYMMPCS